MHLLTKPTNFDFMKYRKVTGATSMVLVFLSLVSLISFKLNFGIDFTGGTLLELGYDKPADLDKIRKVMSDAGYKANVKYYGKSTDVQINIALTAKQKEKVESSEKPKKGDSGAATQTEDAKLDVVLMKLLQKHTSKDVKKRRFVSVGSAVGEELTENGGLALLTALLCILLYVALRFEYRFAVGSVAALVHDVMIVLGIFAVTQIEFDLSVLAALLAVIGYSLNDTIVVFDRIRENFRKIRKGDSLVVINASINETLSRTIMTSVTTLVVLLALLVLGGEVIRGFSIALILGVLVGTYSSIFVASNAALQLGVSRADMLEVKKEGADIVDDRP